MITKYANNAYLTRNKYASFTTECLILITLRSLTCNHGRYFTRRVTHARRAPLDTPVYDPPPPRGPLAPR